MCYREYCQVMQLICLHQITVKTLKISLTDNQDFFNVPCMWSTRNGQSRPNAIYVLLIEVADTIPVRAGPKAEVT